MLFVTFLFAESTITIGNEVFSKNLEFREDIISATSGSFYLTPEDFILTAGKNFQGNPPSSRSSFHYEGEKIFNLGEFNNKAIEILLKKEKESLLKAESMLEAGVEFDPLFFPVRYNFARILEISGKWLEAKDQFLKAKAILPNYYRTYLHLGLLEYKQNHHLEASEFLRTAVRLDPFKNEAKALLCILAFTTGYPASYKRFLDENKFSTKSLSQKACDSARWNSKKIYQKTWKIWKGISNQDYEKEPHYPRYLHLLFAQALEEVGDLEGMEKEYRKLIENPYDWLYFFVEEKTISRKLEIISYLQKNKKSKD